MKIGIIGLGVVGGAIYQYLTTDVKDINVICFDLYKNVGTFKECLQCDILYLCLPTKYDNSSKNFDLLEINATLSKLKVSDFNGLIIIKSTVLPGTIKSIYDKYDKYCLKIVHNPEFLKANSAYLDYKSQKVLIYGTTNNRYYDEIAAVHNKLHPNSLMLICEPNESELLKLASNCYYATQIQFFNEIYSLCNKINCNYDKFINLLKMANLHNIDCTKVPGPDKSLGYGGMCLPKDTNAMLNYMKEKGVIHHQLDATIRERNRLRQDDVNIINNNSNVIKMYNPTRNYHKYSIDYLEIIDEVLSSGEYIGGKYVNQFEKELSEYTGSKYALTASNGTDALMMALMALDIKPGDEVLTVSYSWISTVSMIKLLGGIPIFVDIDQSDFNMDYDDMISKYTEKTKGIIVVSLFGQISKNIEKINQFAKDKNLFVIEDGAQSFGASYKNKKSGTLTTIAITSFFPSKPLGCFGEGGAIFTDSRELYDRISMIRDHGRPSFKCLGINGRLEALQCAILSFKLKHFDNELEIRNRNALIYTKRLAITEIILPIINNLCTHTWAQYTIILANKDVRDNLYQYLLTMDIHAGIYYSTPIHRQEFINSDTILPTTEYLADRVLSLPVDSNLNEMEINLICDKVICFF